MAGACPLRPDGSTTGPNDHAEQARVCLDNLEQALADAGATLTDVVSTRVLVVATAREDLVSAWTVVTERFGAHDVPSTLVGVNMLGYPDQLVEIEAVAAVADGHGTRRQDPEAGGCGPAGSQTSRTVEMERRRSS